MRRIKRSLFSPSGRQYRAMRRCRTFYIGYRYGERVSRAKWARMVRDWGRYIDYRVYIARRRELRTQRLYRSFRARIARPR